MYCAMYSISNSFRYLTSSCEHGSDRTHCQQGYTPILSTSYTRFWGAPADNQYSNFSLTYWLDLLQGDYYSYGPMDGKDVDILNSDRTFNITYKDFITGPLSNELQTGGAFGVDDVTGNGHVSAIQIFIPVLCFAY